MQEQTLRTTTGKLIQLFLKERCVEGEDLRITSQEIRKGCEDIAVQKGFAEYVVLPPLKQFAAYIKEELGRFTPSRTSEGMSFDGIGLKGMPPRRSRGSVPLGDQPLTSKERAARCRAKKRRVPVQMEDIPVLEQAAPAPNPVLSVVPYDLPHRKCFSLPDPDEDPVEQRSSWMVWFIGPKV